MRTTKGQLTLVNFTPEAAAAIGDAEVWEVASALCAGYGRGKRVLLHWATKVSAPHGTRRERAQTVVYFHKPTLDEWVKSKGYDLVKASGRRSAADQASPLLDASEDAPDYEADASSTLASAPASAPASATTAAAEAAPRSIDGRAVLASLYAQLDRVLAQASDSAAKASKDGNASVDPGALQRLTQAIKPLSEEIRRLEGDLAKRDERDGRVIDRDRARDAMLDIAAALVSGLDALAVDLPEAVWKSMVAAGLGGGMDPDEFQRVAAAAAGEACDRVRREVAEQLETTVAAIEQRERRAA